MASTSHTSLEAASSERRARLAKLASLKRKHPEPDTTHADDKTETTSSGTEIYLSGRNYDVSTKGPKLGFENSPAADANTLERRAEAISVSTAEQAAKDEVAAAEKGIDLFKLQPKKPNWDLKRDLAEKMKILDVRTQNAIARLVRERIEKAKKEAAEKQSSVAMKGGEDEGEEIGMAGNELVEGVHLREKEEDEQEEQEDEGEEDVA